MEKRVLKLALGCIMLVSVAVGCARMKPDGEVFATGSAAERTETEPASTAAPPTTAGKPESRKQDIPVFPPETPAEKQVRQEKQEEKETEGIRQSVQEPDARQDPPVWTSQAPASTPKPRVKPTVSPGPAPELVELPEQEAADGDVDVAYGEWSRVD